MPRGKYLHKKGYKHTKKTKIKIGKSKNFLGHKHSKMSKEKIRRETKKAMNKPEVLEKIRGENHYNWKGGISFEPYSIDWTETLRRSIRERDNYICQLCSQYGNTVHHIDYDKKNCDPKNLITLCVSCNIKVNKNRKYWINYFKYNSWN